MEPTSALIGFGANIGDCRETLLATLKSLATAAGVVELLPSSFLETLPVGGPSGQSPFINGAAVIKTKLSPQDFHQLLIETETQFGRVRHERWGPRRVDLDILLFGDCVRTESELQIPHPRMTFRRFVIEPAAEIAPTQVDPMTGALMSDYLKCLNERPPLVEWFGRFGSQAESLKELFGSGQEVVFVEADSASAQAQLESFAAEYRETGRVSRWLFLMHPSGETLRNKSVDLGLSPILSIVPNVKSLRKHSIRNPYLVIGEADVELSLSDLKIELTAAMSAAAPARLSK